jgi:8-oxo-dGTP pyrophosphatase MutT (NUDIX family)
MPTSVSVNSLEPGPRPMGDLRSRLARTHGEVAVWAAGGVVMRSGDGQDEVLLIHRPHRRDWSFPKGKLDEGETLGRTAEREVEEETGFRCRRLLRLPVVRYRDPRDREKLVVYWTMEVLEGSFVPNSEVDAIGWFDPVSAAAVLSYERDVDLLLAMKDLLPDPRPTA